MTDEAISGREIADLVLATRSGRWGTDVGRMASEIGRLNLELARLRDVVPAVHFGTDYGHGSQHKGVRENCPDPNCMDAFAEQRVEQDEETRRVRILLNAVARFIERWAEADSQARTDLWRGLSAATDPVADVFDSRIADLDHRAAQLPDGGLAAKP